MLYTAIYFGIFGIKLIKEVIKMGLFVKGYWDLIRDEQKEWEKKNKR